MSISLNIKGCKRVVVLQGVVICNIWKQGSVFHITEKTALITTFDYGIHFITGGGCINIIQMNAHRE